MGTSKSWKSVKIDPFLEGGGEKKTFHSHHLGEEAQGQPTTSTRMEHAQGSMQKPSTTRGNP
jgi:hypothetical protein